MVGYAELHVSNLGGRARDIIDKKAIRSYDIQGVFKAPLCYSHVTVVPTVDGYFLELSGMIGFDEQGKLVDENAKFQALKALENIERIVTVVAETYEIEDFHGTTALNHIVATRADVVNLSQNSGLVNEAYVLSQMPKAARTMVGVQELSLNALVEITARAYFKK